jgi:hypothetical protein
MNKQVRAYTFMELTVAMLLTSLVSITAYTAFTIIYRVFLQYQGRQEETAIMIQLDRTISQDMEQCMYVLKSAEGLVIINTSKRVSYRFLPTGVIRQISTNTAIDTFRVNLTDLNFYTEQQSIADDPSISVNTPPDKPVDEFSFVLLDHQLKIPYHYYKYYSAADLFNFKAAHRGY